MHFTAGLLLAALLFLVPACSRESLTRTGYETLQNINEQQCEKDFSSQCPERDSYDEYQRRKSENSATSP